MVDVYSDSAKDKKSMIINNQIIFSNPINKAIKEQNIGKKKFGDIN